MMKWKKTLAVLAASVMAATSFAACGESTSYALTIDGVQIPAGVYIYYGYAAYEELVSTLSSQNSDLDTSDVETVKAQSINDEGENKTATQYVADKTMEYCQQYAAIETQFETLGLELDDEDKETIDSTIESFWESNQESYEADGISEDSIRKILENTYKTDSVFYYYYGIDGEKGVTDDSVREYYIENNRRVRYIEFSLTDGNGELLKDDDKAAFEEMVTDWYNDIQSAGDGDAMEEKMADVSEEYSAYVTSISEEAAAETATSATDEDGNEIAATTTTTEVTTTTEEETTTTTTAADADAEGTTVAGDASEKATTTTTAETTTAEEETTAADDASTDEDAETTTTTDITDAESIISKVTTDEDTEEEDITYTPSEKAYNAIFDASATEDALLDIVQDDESDYIIIVRNIEDRMTEEDLWSEDNVKSVISYEYGNEFSDDFLKSLIDGQTVEKNDKAVKRYDPFKLGLIQPTTSSY